MEIADAPPDIIMITEVIPKAQVQPISNARLSVPGYATYLNFDPDTSEISSKGIRGVAIYIRESIQANVTKMEDSCFSEQLWLNIKLVGNDNLLLGCIYRSPSGSAEIQKQRTVELCKLLREATSLNNSHLVIGGDFNYPEIDWANMISTAGTSHHSHLFIQCVQECFLYQLVDEPTRYRPGSRPNTLDLILAKEDGTISNLKYKPGLGGSDHIALDFHIQCYTAPPVSTPRRDTNKGDYVRARNMMNSIPWEDLLRDLDLEAALNVFSSKMEEIIQECIPYKNDHKKKNIYMNRDALKKRKRKYEHWKRFTRTQDYEDYVAFTRERNSLRKITRELRKEFEHKLAKEVKKNPKSFWNYVNSRLNTRTRVDDIEMEDGTLTSNDTERAEVFNNFFSSVFTKENTDHVPTPGYDFTGDPLVDIEISNEKILKKIRKLHRGKSPGPDGLHPRLLSELDECLCTPLRLLFRKSIDSSKLTDMWKTGHVVPIHKKGSRRKAGNYRPVSLTAIISKILESLVRDEILDHMVKHKLFSDDQHGFVPSRSCMTQLLIALDEWTLELDKGEPVDAIYLDFRKAFDTVPHQRLLKKIEHYGIKGKLLDWIRAFLVGRKQKVIINGAHSSWAEVTSGIPQGSVLGPLLFVMFINDMPSVVTNTCKLFADDAKLYGSVKSKENIQSLQSDLQKLEDWCNLWQMGHNTDKCHSLHLGNNNPKHVYTLNGESLVQTSQEKDLGVIIDDGLKFHTHTAKAVAKGFSILAVIKNSFEYIDEVTLPLLFNSRIRPHLEYGNLIWGPHYRIDQMEIERVQRRATKLVPNLRHLPYEDRLKALKMPSLFYRRRRGDMIQVFKIITGIDNIPAEKLFTFAAESRTRGNCHKLRKPLAWKKCRQTVFNVRVVNDWNSLPDRVVKAPSLNQFKNKLDRHWMRDRYCLPV